MNISYKNTKYFKEDELERLFLSVDWSSGKYPDRLVLAMRNSDSVISAWNGEKLIGLVNALSDGVMTAYFHYLLVDPDYQGKGIGRILMEKILINYEDYARKVIVAYNSEISFYERCGFKVGDKASPMFITYLST